MMEFVQCRRLLSNETFLYGIFDLCRKFVLRKRQIINLNKVGEMDLYMFYKGCQMHKTRKIERSLRRCGGCFSMKWLTMAEK